MPNGPPSMVALKGPPPPGAKIIKGPPPNNVVIARGSGSLAVSRRGSISPVAVRSPSPPLGVKFIGKAMPGVKIMAGPPPPGVKALHVVPSSQWNDGRLPQSLAEEGSQVRGLPPGVKLINSPPPRAKLVHGPPPPALGSVSPERARQGANSPSLVQAQSVSPTNLTVYRLLPNGVKVLANPPPARSPVKIVSKSPPRHLSPSPPVMLPTTQKKAMVESNTEGSPAAATSPSTTPLIPPHNESFSLGSKSLPTPKQQLPRPVPVRPGGARIEAGNTVANAPPEHSQRASPTKMHTNAAQLAVQQHESEHVDLNEDLDMDDSDSDDIQFEEETPLKPPPAPRANAMTEKLPESSSSSPSSRKDPDEATAAPPEKTTQRRVGPAPMKSLSSSSSSSTPGTGASAAARKSPHGGSSTEIKEKKSRRKQRRSHREFPRDDTHRDGESLPRRRRRHRHRHHRSHSSEAAEGFTGRAASLQSLQAPLASASSSPVPVDETRRRTPAKRSSSSGEGDHLDTPEIGLGGALHSEAAFTHQALTSALRARIAEDFLSLLCPQQYYGKVHKISRIRPFKADRSAATGLRGSNTIYVATKGVMPNPYFYPQLRLRDTDGENPTSLSGAEGPAEGFMNTPIILYEAAPGNMLFADTELDARRLLESNQHSTSCFMLSNSAILFRDPQHYVLPIASLNVLWVPYASPQSEPQCPVHKRELQLFDPYSKELVCALCASRNGVSMASLIVIPDVLGNADSRRTIQETVSVQLDEAQQSSRRWVEQHQRVRELCENKKEAIRSQFDLLIGALEAKKKEYIEACEADFAYAQTDVAREILITDERVQLLRAASDHLHTEPSKSLFSMQIATIAESLSVGADLPSRFTRASLHLPPMSVGLVPNLEGIMTQVLQLSPHVFTSGGGGGEARLEGPPLTTSPHRIRPSSTLYKGHRSVRSSVNISNADFQQSGLKGSTTAAVSPKSPHPTSASANSLPVHNKASLSASTAPRRSSLAVAVATREHRMNGPTTPHKRSSIGDKRSSIGDKRSSIGDASPTAFTTDALSVPNSTGTSMFDFPLQDLLGTFGTSNMKRRPPRYVQWAVRVEDPGDWVGLGVGVGSTIDAWEQGSANDLSHLWIVPASMKNQVLYLRVAVNAGSGHAKLKVHDARGRPLDCDEVPQWNATRPSYPQATFGGVIGSVRMIEIPHIVY
ncbi:hypothetical protein JKF63_02505 [Porcisia hertigi]|uniref:Uncharacterized protein n=1 Tax=Porcisia hertigi TaxID=2761500 RepID=A0A836L2U7_9TRYP|nr:hypothetical protein JKF63_02505 [Porcisia hertigi]